ncbi:helix-turn-helix domain-containing protein [Streptomyces sp. NPDC050161]|uniref:helix-turn-helix domain-containing protein n=1 Tax=Streptomyces sp. NPDC050161 TaxID=3365604 RepID=UPI00379E4FDB
MPVDAFGGRLNRLFEEVHPPDRGPYTNQEVARMLVDRGGPTLSHVYLWQLRTGRRDNPTRRHLETLAKFFGVPVSYFFDDDVAAKVEGELGFVRQLRECGVRRVATRVAGLSPQSVEQVLDTIEHIREREGLCPGPAGERTDECR